jgi:hypothetical protein
MKTFEISELRHNEKGEAFEVKTKIACKSMAALIKYLQNNPKILWNGRYAAKEDRPQRRTNGDTSQESIDILTRYI